MDFIDDREGRDYSKSYKNTLIKRLQTFFRVNGHPSLKLRTHFMPSRYMLKSLRKGDKSKRL